MLAKESLKLIFNIPFYKNLQNKYEIQGYFTAGENIYNEVSSVLIGNFVYNDKM